MNGHFHPITQAVDRVAQIFTGIGFDVVDGPELESEWYNFDALNTPRDHPSRDMQDTFWINPSSLSPAALTQAEQSALATFGSLGHVLRTHTSGVQVKTMEKWIREGKEFPLAVVVPGKVFRNEATDARHEAQFYQVEGLMIGRDITLANLKGVLEHYFSKFLERDTPVRFRSSFFPFTEPSVEVDMECFKCTGTGNLLLSEVNDPKEHARCSLCSGSGWIEIMGAGMVHPQVLRNAGLDPDAYQGFAFGGGLDRLIMLKTGIDDIRMLYNGDLRLVNQF
jgi:phenylalanyl-tRNA synthetase alpha chain